MTIQLGGETSGVVPEGGNAAIPLYESDPPRAPFHTGGGIGAGIVVNIDNCIPPLGDILMTKSVSDPGEAISRNPTLTIPVPTVGVVKSQATAFLPDDVYIHDGVHLIDTDVSAYNDAGTPYYANPDTPSLGDGLYICHTSKFDFVRYEIDTPGVGTYTMRPAYYNGTEWVAIPEFYSDGDQTNSFKVGGIRWISFIRPDDWTLFNVDGKMRYILKNEINYEGTQTTRPMIKQAYIGAW